MEFLWYGEKKGQGVREEMVKTYTITKVVVWAKLEGWFTKLLNAGTRGCLLKLCTPGDSSVLDSLGAASAISCQVSMVYSPSSCSFASTYCVVSNKSYTGLFLCLLTARMASFGVMWVWKNSGFGLLFFKNKWGRKVSIWWYAAAQLYIGLASKTFCLGARGEVLLHSGVLLVTFSSNLLSMC